MKKLSLLLLLILTVTSFAFSQGAWRFSKAIYLATSGGGASNDVYETTVDPDNNIWIGVGGDLSSHEDPIIRAELSGYGNDIIILNPDGSLKDAIRNFRYLDEGVTLLSNIFRAIGYGTYGGPSGGMRTAPDGKIYTSQGETVVVFDHKKPREIPHAFVPIGRNIGITTPCVDEFGNIVVMYQYPHSSNGGVRASAPPGSSNFYPFIPPASSFNIVIDPKTEPLPYRVSDLALSPDGKDLYIGVDQPTGTDRPEGSSGVAHWHSEEGALGKYTFVKFIGDYKEQAKTIYLDPKGRLWVGVGFVNVSRDSFPRVDCWDLDANKIIYQITSSSPGYGRRTTSALKQGAFSEVYGFAINNECTKAYIVDRPGVLEFELRSIAVDPASLTSGDINNPVNPASIAFGNVNNGSPVTKNIIIKNIGTDPLSITSFNISGERFTFVNNESGRTIAPGNTYELKVQFSPLAPKNYSGTITITDTESNVPTIIQLSGTGVGQEISVEEFEEIPAAYSLEQNYPNPFNPMTTIQYTIPKDEYVKLTVYDITGKVVKELVNGYKSAGRYNVEFNASGYASGTYYYKLEAGEYNSIQKMLLMK